MQKEDRLENKETTGDDHDTLLGLNSCQSDVLYANWEIDGDIFNREQYADRLNNLVKNTKVPYVIALSSAWGTGKTYFLNAWKNKYGYKEGETDKTPCVYFSAWENEEDDPRIAIVSAIKVTLQKSNLLEVKEAESLVKKTVKSFTKPSVLGKLGSRLFKEYLNKKTDNEIDDVFAEVFSEQAESLLDRYAERSESKVDFIKELKSIIEKIKEKTNSPILVMIDELDRCKPDYVISLLEAIKHFFSISGLVFILAIDKNQLLSVVEHTFGLKNEHSQIYLEKFIDLFFELPKADIRTYAIQFIKEHFPILPEEFQDNQEADNYYSTFRVHLHHAVLLRIVESSLSDLNSLRNFEKKFFKFVIIYKAYQPCFAYAMLLLKNILTVDRKVTFKEFLCKDMFEKDALYQEGVWGSAILRVQNFGSSTGNKFRLSTLLKNDDVEYKFDSATPLHEIIFLSLEVMLHNQVVFLPQNSTYTKKELPLNVCSGIAQLKEALSHTTNKSTKKLSQDAIKQIQDELNSMLDFGNLISANDTSNT